MRDKYKDFPCHLKYAQMQDLQDSFETNRICTSMKFVGSRGNQSAIKVYDNIL